ncbi:MAG: flagellar protein [Candidatus Cloacimonadota bacterium]|nr:MAG: flagellar protein [Candidatus Cloacimonadota bacterium]
MICVHKLNKKKTDRYFLNAEFIQIVESTPDTMISLTTGEKYLVSESIEEVVEKIIEYKRLIQSRFNSVNRSVNEG